MPRKARLLVPNCPHHVVQRGHNRKAVFIADQDYQYYLENLNEWKKRLEIKLHAYCLMTNHVHLVVEPGDQPEMISLLMKRLAGRQSAYVNKLERRTGSLWEGRFKASPIQRDEYLMACCRYVDLNPVKAGMVATPDAYRWSGYSERIGIPVTRQLLDSEGIDQGAVYRDFVLGGIGVSEQIFLSEALERNQLSGSDRFIDEIESRLGVRVENRKPGRPRKENCFVQVNI